MLADEITTDLRAIRERARTAAREHGKSVRRPLVSKGIHYGYIRVHADGSIDTSEAAGVDADLRVRPFLAHGGEALASRNAFATLPEPARNAILEFLNTLVLFPPDDTASNLDPGDPGAPGYPQRGHGSINLSVLFNDSTDPE